jgi:hypothetical protein
MSRLHELQAQLNLPHHQLIQDVATRWNSSFYMLERLLEQRQALVLYATENDAVSTLSAFQWDVMKTIVGLLGPFEEATKFVSKESACISDVIPMLAGLKIRLQKAEDASVKAMKATLLQELSSRFQLNEKPLYTVATLLDPRYKNCFFNEATNAAVITEMKQRLAALMAQSEVASCS